MKKRFDKKGFTLVEVIAVLIISSFLVALAGLGIVQLTKSYVSASETSVVSADADFVLTRIRKSVRSLTDVLSASESELEIERVNLNNETVTEKFLSDSNSLKLFVNDQDYGPLAEDYKSFKFSYQNADEASGDWTMSDDIGDLASVTAEITYSGPDSSELIFSEKILPRNTFRPDGYSSSGTGANLDSAPCFIAAAGSDYNFVLKDFVFKNKVIFYASGFCFLFIFFFFKGSKKTFFKKSEKGSLLITIVISITVVGILGAGAVSLLTSGKSRNVSKMFGQRAYYNAESGLRYALSEFMDHRESDEVFAQNIINNNEIYKITDSQGFYLDFQPFYFRYDSEDKLKSTGNFPDEIKKTGNIAQGIFDLKRESEPLRTRHEVQSISYDPSNKVIEAEGLPDDIDMDENIFPVVKANGDQTGIKASDIGKSQQLGEINVTGGFIRFMPPVNGIINFYGDTDKDGSYDDSVSLMYDRFDYSSGKIKGLRNIPGKSVPSSGFNIESGTDIIPGRYAKIISTGAAGIGTSQEARTVLALNQPLDTAELVKMITNDIDGIESVESLLGTHGIVEVDSTDALKVNSTDQSYSYTNSPRNNPVYQQESLAAYDWSSQDPDFLKNLWLKSDKKLSYEVQVKVKFTETEDDLSSDPLNHPGNYMPGLSFRVRKPQQGDIGQATYYGMSFMRGIAGTTEHRGSGRCGDDFETENDDITDNFFYPEADHGENIVNEPEYSCSDTDFTPSTWNDDPPLDGIPYVVFWQKSQSTDSDGDPVSTGCGGGGTYSPFEWLSYMPLVEAEKSQIYHYDSKVVLYDRNNFNGELVSLSKGEYTLSQLESIADSDFNDEVNSVEVPAGFSVTLFEHDNFNGASLELNSDERNLGGWWRNRVSSVKIEYTGDPVPSGYYDGAVHGFSADETYTAWRLTDKYNILKRHEVDGQQNILGLPGQIKVKDPDNPEKLMENKAYILAPDDNDQEVKARANYRLYIKPWATLGLRIMEFEGNLDCDPGGELERINAVTAFFGSEDQTGSSFEDLKDGSRKAYVKNNTSSGGDSVKWPSDGDYFTRAVWKGLGFDNSSEPRFPTDGGYSSKTVPNPDYGGCLSSFSNIKLVEKGFDSEGDPVTVYSATFLTQGGNLGTEDYFQNHDVPEIGLHTLGVNANEEAPEEQRETVYFKDFYWRFFEGGNSGVLPGVITE
jgi:prepilin-type N-terminal cleavage/methylation domain-containing protein